MDSDKTGARICAASYRKVVLAIRAGAELMSGSALSVISRMLVSLLASTMYFQWPSQEFILRITSLKSKDPTAARLALIGADVYEHFDASRVVDGF